MPKATMVLDTNILLRDHTVAFTMKDTNIILPQIVIQEMDKKKTSEDRSVGFNARAFCRKIKKLMKEQGTTALALSGGSTLRIIAHDPELEKHIVSLGLDPKKPDHIIVATAQANNARLCTNDVAMWVTAMALGIEVEDHEGNSQFQSLYSGVRTIETDDTVIIDEVYSGEDVFLNEDEFPGLHVNQILVFKSLVSRHSSLIVVFEGYETALKRIPKKEKMSFAGITPLNKEQSFAYQLLKNNHISCVTLTGRAGTGKSIVSLAYAMHKLDDKQIEKIIVLKPIAPVGKDIGFLPGTIDEKLEPWMESFRDSLDLIFRSEEGFKNSDERTYDYLIENGILEFKPLTFMRGRSIQNTLIILDEAQNTSVHEIKTLLTRVGEGSKIICLGDVEQIDVPWLDQQNNGLSYLVERGKDSSLLGHITFIKAHRSDLADWASINL